MRAGNVCSGHAFSSEMLSTPQGDCHEQLLLLNERSEFTSQHYIGETDIVHEFADPVPVMVTLHKLGMPIDDWRRYAEPMHKTVFLRQDNPPRAGVLEQVTVSLMARLGLDQRLKAEGLPHDGFNLADGERLIRIDIARLTGKHVVVYGQTELTRDLIAAAPDRGLEIVFEAADVVLHDVDGSAPSVTWSKDGATQRVDADFIAGCDGFHGPSRKAFPTV